MFPLVKVDDVTHVIQLAVAPVFLLTAVATFISVLTNRLARIVDRIRVVENSQELASPDAAHFGLRELELLGRRLRMVYIALTCEVSCGLIVGVIIAIAFIDAFLAASLSGWVAALFVLAMVAFVSGLASFLREIFLAVQSTRSSIRVNFL